MSYIIEENTKESFLDSLTITKRSIYTTALNQFNSFTIDTYQKKGEVVLSDLMELVKKENTNERIYTLLHQFVQWLLIDHPNLQIIAGNAQTKYSRPMKARHPETARVYSQYLTTYIEHKFRIELSRKIWKKRINIPSIEEEDPDPFTQEEVRLVIDNCSPKKKLLYMVLKDSGMRIGETCSLRKKDFDTTKDPVEIHIPARFTKTKKARITFVTMETKTLLIKRLENLQDDEVVFATSRTPDKSTDAEWQTFNNLRKRIGLTDKYQNNGRYKKTIHSFRSYTATQATKAVDESWGHSLLGHSKYLGQYIRNQEEYAHFYKRTEPYLMIYEKIEVIDHTTSLDEMKDQLKEEFRREREEFMTLLNKRDSLSKLIKK
ncbi:MAG TPA: tyrosine-type recombinase/integrase [Nitrosopumilaceae archaeon]|nr:tyrosine-type recombinase/integrase [Nitrosopumilaceae archaeon]